LFRPAWLRWRSAGSDSQRSTNSVLSMRQGVRRLLLGKPAVAQTAPTAPQPRFKGWYPDAPVILGGTIAAWVYWERKGPIV
jgi:hypothetical protein